MKRYFFKIAFDGLDFSGWQRQADAKTIQQTVEDALELMLQRKVRIHGCGRTDAGVSAEEFYFNIDLEKEPNFIAKKLNRMLPREIAILSHYEVSSHANAQKNATSRTYRYTISLTKNPFNRRTWQVLEPLDTKLMRDAVAYLKGTHDFKYFCKRPDSMDNTTCVIQHCLLDYSKELINIDISGNRFLHHMVRLLVGNIVKVGKGRITVEDFREYVDTYKRPPHFELAPAAGLTLSKVKYM